MADPGFPRGGGAKPPGRAPTYGFAKFPQKLHEIERIWTRGHPKFYYVDPPLIEEWHLMPCQLSEGASGKLEDALQSNNYTGGCSPSLQRAARILLECFLVSIWFEKTCKGVTQTLFCIGNRGCATVYILDPLSSQPNNCTGLPPCIYHS